MVSGSLSASNARAVFSEALETGVPLDELIVKKGLLSQPEDSADLEQWCRDAIAANPKSLADFKAGKESAINGFKGAVMKAAKGKADPKQVDATLRRLLATI